MFFFISVPPLCPLGPGEPALFPRLFFYGNIHYYAVLENPENPIPLFMGNVFYPLAPAAPFTKSVPGFRLGGGIELDLKGRAFFAGFETGWDGLELSGASVAADSCSLVPLSLGAGAAHVITPGVTLTTSLFFGWFIAVAGEGPALSFFSFFLGPRVKVETGRRGWFLFAGLGADFIPQAEGMVSLPSLEVGVIRRLKR